MAQDSVQDLLRKIPAVDQLLLRPKLAEWVGRTSRGFVVAEIQRILDDVRHSIRSGGSAHPAAMEPEMLENALDSALCARLRPALRPVVNATGVILHTNLGRAVLSDAARESLSAVSGQYSNLEYDIPAGGRSHREKILEEILRDVLGCEASAVVNNNAAAVFLILNTLARGLEVVVSRGELVEIGGSFRIPEIMARSGAILREVGTTNKTRVEDYEAAINPDTALMLRVHPSNYRIHGFTHRPGLEEMVDLARRKGVPLVEDIGSGCLVDLGPWGIDDEPTAQESISAGVDLVCFSGDKLMGGPQAGIIAGARRWIDPIRKNPLMRTLRVDKLIYSALEATLASFRTGRAFEEVPVLRMMSASREDIRKRSLRFARRLRRAIGESGSVRAVEGFSVVGGGSCPEAQLPTTLLALESGRYRPHELEERLRAQDPAVIIRLEEDRALVDLRTVLPFQESTLLEGIRAALA